MASMDSYGDSFPFLYVNDIRTSEEKHLWPSTACYRNSKNERFTVGGSLHKHLTTKAKRQIELVSVLNDFSNNSLGCAWGGT
jgi:hypothetical protein